jgi:hypothetical protein
MLRGHSRSYLVLRLGPELLEQRITVQGLRHSVGHVKQTSNAAARTEEMHEMQKQNVGCDVKQSSTP